MSDLAIRIIRTNVWTSSGKTQNIVYSGNARGLIPANGGFSNNVRCLSEKRVWYYQSTG